jgi:hypothetical protein
MNRTRSAAIRRFALSAAIALPLTVALIFLMTRLILPGEQDRVVSRMIQNIEFLRAQSVPAAAAIQVFERPLPIEDMAPPIEQRSVADGSAKTQNQTTVIDEGPTEDGSDHLIDWWAEARRLTQESDEDALKRWLLEQGFERYVSIMQGPFPITNSVRGELPPTQEDITGYLNNYGDLEFKISENCVMQTLVSVRLDISDFAESLPMRVTCKPPPKVKYSFERD